MESTLIIGIVIIVGFIFGELAERTGFPKVTGYILAGIILNPDLSDFIPADFTDSATPITNIALSFITFSVGGTLLYSRIKKLGFTILVRDIIDFRKIIICRCNMRMLLTVNIFIDGKHPLVKRFSLIIFT